MVVDILILAIILLSVLMGYKKGLVNVIFKIFAFIVALIVTIILYRPITNLVIDNTQIDEKIEAIILENGIKQTEAKNNQNNINEYVENYISNVAINTQNQIVTSSAKIISENVIGIAVMIVLFIVTRILLIFIRFVTDAIASLPIIKQCNKLGGALYGLLRGLFVVYVILAIMFFIVSLNSGSNLFNLIDKSIIAKMMYANNVVLKVLF